MENNDKQSEKLENLNKKIAENPDDANLFRERAELNLENGKGIECWKDICKDINKAIELDPQNADFYNLRGSLNYAFYKISTEKEEGKQLTNYLFNSAIDDYKKALEQKPDDKDVIFDLLQIYLEIKDYDKIYKYLKNIDLFSIDDIGEENFKILIEIIEFFEKNGDYDKAIDLYERINPFDYGDIRGESLADNQIIILKLYKEKAQIINQAQKDMMSFLTHTLNGALGTGSMTLKNVISNLSNEKDYKANDINKLTSLFSSFSLVTTMLNSYKIYIQDKDKFRENWKNDNGKEANIKVVLTNILRYIFTEWFFVRDASYRQKLLSGCDKFRDKNSLKDYIRKIKQNFIKEIMATDINSKNADEIIEWFQKRLIFLDIKIIGKPVCFNKNNIRFGLFFAIFNELIINALKYSDGHTPIKIIWDEDNDFYIFKCINTTKKKHLENSFKSKKGLTFISHLMAFFDGKDLINYRTKENLFEVFVKFPKNMFREEKL